MSLETKIQDFTNELNESYPNIGRGTVKNLIDAFARGYNDGYRSASIDLTRKESEPIEEHKLGDKLL